MGEGAARPAGEIASDTASLGLVTEHSMDKPKMEPPGTLRPHTGCTSKGSGIECPGGVCTPPFSQPCLQWPGQGISPAG